jgi:hypothetical protein
MGVRKLSLAIAFKNGKNLADLTSAWLRHVKAQLQVVGVDPKVKLQVGDSASLVAPAALVAGIIVESGLPYEHRPLRVLLIGSDPFVRFDHSTWASMAGDLLGCPGGVEIFLNVEEEAISSGYPIAQALNLKHCSVISHSETRNCARDSLDLAIWIHPAAEALDDAEIENRITALHLAAAGVPTYASALNEADLLGQNYLLNEHAVELQPLGGELARGSRAINRFGISTTSLGVEGGWAAILTKVVPASSHVDIQDVQPVLRRGRYSQLLESWTAHQRCGVQSRLACWVDWQYVGRCKDRTSVLRERCDQRAGDRGASVEYETRHHASHKTGSAALGLRRKALIPVGITEGGQQT